MAELFGFKITRSKDEGESFTLPTSDDGTIEVAGGGFFSSVLDTDGRDKTENDLIRRYRDIAMQPECDSAIEDIVSEGIASNEYDAPVALRLDRLEYSTKVKKRIHEEFDRVLQLLDFNVKGHDIFRRWYVDGRIYYHKVIDKKDPRKGITELRYIDPRKIKKVREVVKDNQTHLLALIKQKRQLSITSIMKRCQIINQHHRLHSKLQKIPSHIVLLDWLTKLKVQCCLIYIRQSNLSIS